MNPINAFNFSVKHSVSSVVNQMGDNKNDANNNELNIEEKLKVDRKKFETLLEGNDMDNGSADVFFGRIMSEFPSVMITWPPRLKSGTKSKKDPHVKLSGIPLMVKAARIKILESLDPRRDRVTLKMDIDWTAHSHMIGKAGASIQKVMDKTGCHVHFPDANRTNSNEKSNQVSISGTVSGVKDARIEIRELLPVIVYFNLLLKFNDRSVFLDKLNRIIQFVEKLAEIHITLRFNATSHERRESNTVTLFVRGVYGKYNLIGLGIDLLLNYLNDFVIKEEITYDLETQISLNHHNFILGVDNSNLRSIMQTTGAIITFPENKRNSCEYNILSRFTIPSPTSQNRKTTINIKGLTVNSVLMAFHLIELHIPLSLTFDLKEGQELSAQTIEMLSNNWNVFITVKPKPKQNTKTIWIKGAEKDEWKLFEVRRYLIEGQHTTTSLLNSTPEQIWFNKRFDVNLIWSSTQTIDNSVLKINSMDSCSTNAIGFERAPGAERNFKMY